MDKYINVIITVASAVSVIIPLIVSLIVQVNKAVKDKDWIKISSNLTHYISQAEQFEHFSGLEKKKWVIGELIKFAVENKISFDSEKVSKAIDNLVMLTKKVNQRDKDKNNEEQNNII